MTIAEYKRIQQIPPLGTRCQTALVLKDTLGFIVSPVHIKVREAGLAGTVQGAVPGHGGDVWWVRHYDGNVGAYWAEEVVDILPPYEKLTRFQKIQRRKAKTDG